jgi:hypothetical protein
LGSRFFRAGGAGVGGGDSGRDSLPVRVAVPLGALRRARYDCTDQADELTVPYEGSRPDFVRNVLSQLRVQPSLSAAST